MLVFHSHWFFDSDGAPCRSYGCPGGQGGNLTKIDQKAAFRLHDSGCLFPLVVDALYSLAFLSSP